MYRRLKMWGIPWTPELAYIRLGIEVWILAHNKNKGYKVSARKIAMKKTKADMDVTASEEIIIF